MLASSWILSSKLCGLACLVYVAYVGGVGAELLDLQRQQLPFGELIFPVPARVSNESEVLTSLRAKEDALEINMPKIGAMADSHTDDGSVISRHYSATLVESAWRNRINNSTMDYFLENTRMDVSSLSLFAASYLSSLLIMSLTRKV